MTSYLLKIVYEPVPNWSMETAHLFDPPRDPYNLADSCRKFTIQIPALDRRDALKKAFEIRQSANDERYISAANVVSISARRFSTLGDT